MINYNYKCETNMYTYIIKECVNYGGATDYFIITFKCFVPYLFKVIRVMSVK